MAALATRVPVALSKTRTGRRAPARAVATSKATQLAVAAAASTVLAASSAFGASLTKDEFASLTYLQVKGTGLANTCTVVKADDAPSALKQGSYELTHLCMEPTAVTVKDDDNWLSTKLMTRLTYTLDEISGKATVGSNGAFTFAEEDGIDYAATTVQLPGGERVPFLFTVKQLKANGTFGEWGGSYTVPSYRGSSFLDPKGRGGSLGRDAAMALPAGGRETSDELQRENIKETTPLAGNVVFKTGAIDASTGEIAGVFESVQPSDTDLGAKAPKEVKIQGIWYAQLDKAS